MSRDWHESWCPKKSYATQYDPCTCHRIPPDVIKRAEAAKAKMKRENPKEHHRIYCGFGV